MGNTYWIVRYKAKGRKKADPVLATLRYTRFDSIRAAVAQKKGDWNDIKKLFGLECVKVQLIDSIAAPYIAKL